MNGNTKKLLAGVAGIGTVALLVSSAPVLQATAKMVGIDTVSERQAAVEAVNRRVDEVEDMMLIINGKLDCVLQDISFAECPASQWRPARRSSPVR